MPTRLVRNKLWWIGFVTIIGFICVGVSAGFNTSVF